MWLPLYLLFIILGLASWAGYNVVLLFLVLSLKTKIIFHFQLRQQVLQVLTTWWFDQVAPPVGWDPQQDGQWVPVRVLTLVARARYTLNREHRVTIAYVPTGEH